MSFIKMKPHKRDKDRERMRKRKKLHVIESGSVVSKHFHVLKPSFFHHVAVCPSIIALYKVALFPNVYRPVNNVPPFPCVPFRCNL